MNSPFSLCLVYKGHLALADSVTGVTCPTGPGSHGFGRQRSELTHTTEVAGGMV